MGANRSYGNYNDGLAAHPMRHFSPAHFHKLGYITHNTKFNATQAGCPRYPKWREFNLLKRMPLYLRLLIGVGFGTLLGVIFHEKPSPALEKPSKAPEAYVLPADHPQPHPEDANKNVHASTHTNWCAIFQAVGMLVIRLLKALATPLIFFAVTDALLKTHIPPKKGLTLVSISAINAVVAIVIGLSCANFLRGGAQWRGRIEVLKSEAGVKELKKDEIKPTLDPIQNISSYVPVNLVSPFSENNVIVVVLLAVLFGAAARKLKDRGNPDTLPGLQSIEDSVHAAFTICTQILEWIVALIPIAVCGVVAGVVGTTGAGTFGILGVFLFTVLLGLFIHSVLYYSLLLWVVGRTSPRRFYSGALDAIVTALSCGSSLATLPVTLRCLNDKLKISPGSARLAACVGTNLNHAGIILYEAAATIFVAQALGYELSLGQQITVALASVACGVGIAGVPDAGLITLPLVLSTAGIPADAVATVVPLLFLVDWIIGRCRAATNVISDMTVATLLDRIHPEPEATLVRQPMPVAVVME